MHPRLVLCVALVCCLLGLAGTAAAAQSYAVAPFTIHGPEKYHYLSRGIQSMITSRLSSRTELQAKDVPQLKEAGDLSRAEARDIIRKADLDYLVYGDVTMMGEQSSLNLKVLDREEDLLTRTSQMPIADIIPRLDEMVGGVKQDLGFAVQRQEQARDVASGSERSARQAQDRNETERRKLNQQFEQQKRVQRDQSREGGLNPQFEQQKRPEQTAGRWRSPELDFDAHGMRVGDVNGDGRQEILLLEERAVKAFVQREDRLEHLATHELGSRVKALTLDLTPPDSEGFRRIAVSAVQNEKPRSLMLDFREGDFTVRAEDIRLFFNVVRIPPDYAPRLVGQKLDAPGRFDNGVSLVAGESGDYSLGRTLELPSAANVFNFAYLPEPNGYKVIVADATSSLRVYSSAGELQASTNTAYAGSEVKIRKKTSLPGLEESREDPPQYYFLPTRIIPCDLNGDGEFEIVVNRGISNLSKFLANQRSYSGGEIHSLYWDGLGLSTDWKTRTIKGAVQDYGLGDMNNDGTLELYVCINTKSGMLSWGGKKTFLLAYPLDLPQDSVQGIFRP